MSMISLVVWMLLFVVGDGFPMVRRSQQQQRQLQDVLVIQDSFYVIKFLQLNQEDYILLQDGLEILGKEIVSDDVLDGRNVRFLEDSVVFSQSAQPCNHPTSGTVTCEHLFFRYSFETTLSDQEMIHNRYADATKIAIRDGRLEDIVELLNPQKSMSIQQATGTMYAPPPTNYTRPVPPPPYEPYEDNNNDDTSSGNWLEDHKWDLVIAVSVLMVVVVIALVIILFFLVKNSKRRVVETREEEVITERKKSITYSQNSDSDSESDSESSYSEVSA